MITPDALADLAIGDSLDSDTALLPGIAPEGVSLTLAAITETGYTFEASYKGVRLGRVEARTQGRVLTWHEIS